jgi:excisionase family DNA binding protein
MDTDDRKTERLVFTIAETAKMLGISRGTAYLLANSGGIPAIRVSKRRLIVPRKALEDFLSSAGRGKENQAMREGRDESHWPEEDTLCQWFVLFVDSGISLACQSEKTDSARRFSGVVYHVSGLRHWWQVPTGYRRQSVMR